VPLRIDESDVTLSIDGYQIGYVHRYEVEYGIFTQPGTFTISVGWSQSAGKLIKSIKPYMPFKLNVGGKPAFSGRLDSIVVREGGEGTEVVLTGRDNIGDLFRYKIDRDIHFSKSTYVGLLNDVLEYINISPRVVLGDATEIANKRLGKPVRRYGIALDPDTEQFLIKESVSTINSNISAKLGDTFYSFLKAYFDRSNLFLWSGTDNEFILSRPNTKQDPVCQLLRGRDLDSLKNRANCKLVEYKNDISDRHAFIHTNVRVGTTKAGRTSMIGSVTDEEVLALGLRNFRSVRDKKTNNAKQAEDMGKRILAEERRKSNRLIYVTAGHRTKSTGGAEIVYTPDTIVRILDEELGIDAPYYLETVKHKRDIGSGTTSQLTFVKPEHMVF
jgi:prophage tail gpP-like protein